MLSSAKVINIQIDKAISRKCRSCFVYVTLVCLCMGCYGNMLPVTVLSKYINIDG